MAALSSCIPHMCQNQISVVHSFRPEKKKRCQVASCITLTGKYQTCVTHDVWQKSGESESWSFSAAVWMCPCLSICLSWLPLSVPSVGSVCLPVPACACHLSIIFSMSFSPSTGLLQCPVWTNFLSFFALCTPSSLSPSLLTPSFCPFRTWLSYSQSQMD